MTKPKRKSDTTIPAPNSKKSLSEKNKINKINNNPSQESFYLPEKYPADNCYEAALKNFHISTQDQLEANGSKENSENVRDLSILSIENLSLNENHDELCSKCNKNIKSEYLECDCCKIKLHQKCFNLKNTETKIVLLQKRSLIILCDICKGLLKKIPYIITILETLQEEITSIKKNIETKSLSNIDKTSYVSVVKAHPEKPETKLSNSLPGIIIKPKNKQEVRETKSDIQQNIFPNKSGIKIRNKKEFSDGKIIINCSRPEDLEKFKKEANEKLKDKYEIMETKLKKPRIKIIRYNQDLNSEEIENSLKLQNNIEENDLKIIYIKTYQNQTKTIFAECSPKAFNYLMKQKKVCIGWETFPVFEDFNILKCYKCQQFNHKSTRCLNNEVCQKCAGQHETKTCTKNLKKCTNCVFANEKFKKKYNINHETFDLTCPCLQYQIMSTKSRINYEFDT